MAELREYIYSKKPGDEVRIIYLKNNKKTEIKLKLAKNNKELVKSSFFWSRCCYDPRAIFYDI